MNDNKICLTRDTVAAVLCTVMCFSGINPVCAGREVKRAHYPWCHFSE